MYGGTERRRRGFRIITVGTGVWGISVSWALRTCLCRAARARLRSLRSPGVNRGFFGSLAGLGLGMGLSAGAFGLTCVARLGVRFLSLGGLLPGCLGLGVLEGIRQKL